VDDKGALSSEVFVQWGGKKEYISSIGLFEGTS
jgi:hypothetical protein